VPNIHPADLTDLQKTYHKTSSISPRLGAAAAPGAPCRPAVVQPCDVVSVRPACQVCKAFRLANGKYRGEDQLSENQLRHSAALARETWGAWDVLCLKDDLGC